MPSFLGLDFQCPEFFSSGFSVFYVACYGFLQRIFFTAQVFYRAHFIVFYSAFFIARMRWFFTVLVGWFFTSCFL